MLILKPTFLLVIVVIFSIIVSKSAATEIEELLNCGISGCARGYIFIADKCTCIEEHEIRIKA